VCVWVHGSLTPMQALAARPAASSPWGAADGRQSRSEGAALSDRGSRNVCHESRLSINLLLTKAAGAVSKYSPGTWVRNAECAIQSALSMKVRSDTI